MNMGDMLDKLDLSQFEEQFKLKTKPTLSNVAKIIKRKVSYYMIPRYLLIS